MAKIVGKPCTPHISGDGLGFLYMMHFASFVPNIGPYQEFKGNEDGIPIESSVSLQPSEGRISVPDAPGLGITFDPAFLDKAERVKAL
jgi:L-alanine-DL-glutamate epimerase-like enolase superfamily enzyme